jgi:aryl-alcohol dehydrogenase-like predicted oxidoreductase
MIPIPGTKHMDWMIENAGAANVSLDAATVAELDALINEDTVAGYRYTDALMKSTDSEKDWPR